MLMMMPPFPCSSFAGRRSRLALAGRGVVGRGWPAPACQVGGEGLWDLWQALSLVREVVGRGGGGGRSGGWRREEGGLVSKWETDAGGWRERWRAGGERSGVQVGDRCRSSSLDTWARGQPGGGRSGGRWERDAGGRREGRRGGRSRPAWEATTCRRAGDRRLLDLFRIITVYVAKLSRSL